MRTCQNCGIEWNSREGKAAKYCNRACYYEGRKKAAALAGPNRFDEDMTLYERLRAIKKDYGVQ
jgi:hypothetical protein